ncbi:MAG: Rpn family recombination-promoting nuclease/putative transposase [Myxococcaceae bacterium]|jgi:hypothetical protein|nr:Rpn family recombination-promoting nuclease/putative transposase [Myxococcaceae bacterium]
MAKNEKDEQDAKELHETPHDAYVRVVLVHPGLLAAQVRAALPEAVWHQLNLEGAETKAARFIDERLKALESDAVFEVSSTNGDVQVFVLLEHQRTVPWHMPLRVLRYVTGFWHSKLTEDPTMRRLPLVIPLVVANVPGGWRGARRLADLLEGPPALVKALAPFLPRFDLVIDDLATLDLATVLAREGPPAAKLMWWALSVSTDLSRVEAELSAMLPTMRETFQQAPGLFSATATYLQSLPMSESKRLSITTTFELIPMEEYRREHPEAFMDPEKELSRWVGWKEGRIEGRAVGREEGRIEGRAEGRETGLAEGVAKGQALAQAEAKAALVEAMLAIWPMRFGSPASGDVRTRLAHADVPTITQWMVRVHTAQTPDDVFAAA